MPARNAHSILILKLSSLGDIIHTMPAFSVLRKGYPDSKITWAVDERWSGILEDTPGLDHIITLDKKGLGVSPPAWRNAGKRLQGSHPDICIDFQGLFYTGVLSYLSGARRRIGFASAREFSPFFYTDRARIPFEGIHAVDRYLKLARYAGGAESAVEFKIVIREEDREYIRGISGNYQGPHIAVHAGARWQTKRWALEGFAEAADYLAGKYGARIILIGAGEDEPHNNRLKSLMKTAPLDLSGRTTLKQLAALFEKTDLLITNDSGPMHIAAALGAPVLAIFGPTDPVRTGPYGQEGNVISRNLSCSPCFKKRCRGMICLEEIPVEEVIPAAERIMERVQK